MKLKLLFAALLLCVSIMGCEEDTPPRKGKSDAVFNPNLTYGSMTDIDGNEYKTIKIGRQTWMAQNLRVTHYRNGDPINFDTAPSTIWLPEYSKEGTYCTPYYTTNLDTIATYGLLYNGYAVKDNRNIAPKGWRIPTREDLEQLWEYLKTLETPEDRMRGGGRLKEVGSKHWASPNIANNSTGFTLLPTPCRNPRAFGLGEGYHAVLFTTSKFRREEDSERLFIFSYSSMSDIAYSTGACELFQGTAIRCIKEE